MLNAQEITAEMQQVLTLHEVAPPVINNVQENLARLPLWELQAYWADSTRRGMSPLDRARNGWRRSSERTPWRLLGASKHRRLRAWATPAVGTWAW